MVDDDMYALAREAPNDQSDRIAEERAIIDHR
jgi:hypothetical protein